MSPRPLTTADAAAVIGVLAVLEGESLAGQLDAHLALSLHRRLIFAPSLRESDQQQLRQALNDLNQRVRFAQGEYPEPPRPAPVL